MRKNFLGTRTLAVGGVAVLALTLSACGGPSESDVRDALKKDIGKVMKGVPQAKQDKMTDCLTDVMMEDADQDDLQKYVDGEIKIDDVKAEDGKDTDDSSKKCAKEAM
ncbi:hypothetical protein [Streptomyces sp. 3N207]|uniref:hypothetical protein n=1 Tax=Streptomyces sp. 3N207 TaxID=3457417 RepID=UPI003FCF23DB